MKVIILGSGGCQTIPRPCCNCDVCTEARKKGIPYARSGPAIFIDDYNILFDTPEEVSYQLNREKIKRVDAVFYTHWDPDHTLGMRVFELLNMNWLVRKAENNPINIYMPEGVYEDILQLSSKFSPFFEYYAGLGLIKLFKIKFNEPVKVNGAKITPLKIKRDSNVAVYVIEGDGKRVCYAPCDTYRFPIDKKTKNLDLLIRFTGYFPDVLEDASKDSVINDMSESFDEVLKEIELLGPKKTVFTHIEEMWGKTFDDYRKIERKNKNKKIKFAHDGMKIDL